MAIKAVHNLVSLAEETSSDSSVFMVRETTDFSGSILPKEAQDKVLVSFSSISAIREEGDDSPSKIKASKVQRKKTKNTGNRGGGVSRKEDESEEDEVVKMCCPNLRRIEMKSSKVNLGFYRPLIRAIQENNVKAQKDFLYENPNAMKSEIDEFGNTFFHLIVDRRSSNSETVNLLKELVSKVLVESPKTLEILNVANMTALDIAASAGYTEAVKVFVSKHLFSKAEEALHLAALWGQKEAVRYLLSVSEEFALESGAHLLKLLIESNLHDIPVKDDQDHVDWRTRHSGDEDGDLEMQNDKSSTNSSEKSQIAATFGM
ncbi:hypothetical protein LWI28_026186 [Acer negundo]|uniref:Uncharacterized protein n=1 Tax=Acer negundo TaxID=4023 RepID=A0AAD5J7H6_ACENE|nr:hypothetical protein LWI28_026186 [Acer negundo]